METRRRHILQKGGFSILFKTYAPQNQETRIYQRKDQHFSCVYVGQTTVCVGPPLFLEGH